MAYKNKNKDLIKLLHSRFNESDEDSRGWDEDMDDKEDDLFEDNGFGDPMDTFVTPNRNRRQRRNDDDYSMDDDTSDDFESLDDMEDKEDMDDEDMTPSKSDRKNLAVITIGKKIGKGKSKKM